MKYDKKQILFSLILFQNLFLAWALQKEKFKLIHKLYADVNVKKTLFSCINNDILDK
jgi:hypothetical protein